MKKILLSICLFTGMNTIAQTRLKDKNTIGWYSTTIAPKISEKFSGHIEYQWRRTKLITNWQQSLLRLGMTYKMSPNVQFQAGYGWAHTFDYGEYFLMSTRRSFDEHRIYEQAVISSNVGRLKYSTRLRLEQRWLGIYANAEDTKVARWNYLNRFRIMPRVDVPLGKNWYAAAYDEMCLGFGKNIGQNVFDQNRVAAMLGYEFNKNIKIEGGFLNQTVQFGRQINQKNVFQYNNGIILNTYFNL